MPLLSPIEIEISPGELFDKVTILRIKSRRFTDAAKLKHVETELAMLEAAAQRSVAPSERLDALAERLTRVNEQLWQVEDDIRVCERDQEFGPRFVELARSVYRLNDERSAIKREINVVLESELIEEKQHIRYG